MDKLSKQEQEFLTKYLKKHDLDKEEYTIAVSGEAPVLIFPEVVVKLFPGKRPKDRELEFYEENPDVEGILPLLDFEIEPLGIKMYPRIETVEPELDFKDPLYISKLVCDMAEALENLHKLGWIHGDTGHKNIGVYGRKFVLFDLEDIVKSTDANKRYNDVKNFLEDLRIQLKRVKEPGQAKLIEGFLQKLETKFIKKEEKLVKFLGKERIREVAISNYKSNGFKTVLGDFCKYQVDPVQRPMVKKSLRLTSQS